MTRVRFVSFSFLIFIFASSTLFGQSSAIFSAAITYNYPVTRIAVADVNGDGKPDVLVVNPCGASSNCTAGDGTSGSAGVLLGNGDGTFQAEVAYGSGGSVPLSVAVGDVNGDGKPDLLVANECASSSCANGVVAVLLGNGDGTFQTATAYSSGGTGASTIAVSDLRGDGKLDVVVTNYGCTQSICPGSVAVLLGNGDGTFQTAVSYGSGGYIAESMAVADVNGDGKPDLLVANDCQSINSCDPSNPGLDGPGSVGVLLGNGDGTFQTAIAYSSGGSFAVSVAVADVNGDRKPDLLVTNQCALSCTVNGVRNGEGFVDVLLGNGDGTFQTAVSHDSGGLDASSVTVADVNGDGKPDLVVGNQCALGSGCVNVGGVGVLLGNGDGTFQAAVEYNTDGNGISSSVVVADVTGNGKPDLLVADDAVAVLLNISQYFHVTISGSPQQPLTKNSSGDFVALVTITNTGNVTITSAQVTIAGTTLGSASLLAAPPPIKNLAPGASAVVTLTFPDPAALSKATTAPLKVSGTYAVPAVPLSGNWALSFRSVTL